MVLIKEYRIALPLAVEEYRIAQLYMVSKFSREQTSHGEGIEVLVNEPYKDDKGSGQFTHKRIFLGSYVSTAVLPYSVMVSFHYANKCIVSFYSTTLSLFGYVEEKAWNAYPYVKTVYWSPFFGGRFSITQETRYMENDDGKSENVLNLPPDVLNHREVDYIDILTDTVDPKYYKKEEDPRYFHSQRTGRGPLVEGWQQTHKPLMWVYKVATVEFQYWGFQTKVEAWLQKSMVRDILVLGHKQAFTWIDEWWGLTMDKIRKIEEETKVLLDRLRNGEKVESTAIDVSRFRDEEEKKPETKEETRLETQQETKE